MHWPFCAAKCPYCDFNSHVHRGPFDEEAFVENYLTEISQTAELVPGRTVRSIFFGGGTPSLMQPQSVEKIINAISTKWQLSNDVEITLEANPTSVEREKFQAIRLAGVNRVSLGVQSLRAEPLAALGRLHSVEDAKAAVKLAQSIFDRVSYDLIYARPNQTLDEWREELNEALDLAREHISLYALTIESGTRYYDLFHAGKLNMPGPELSADFYELTQEICDARGLPAYEISNHAAPGEESRHNLTYWQYGEYAGIGPGAHGRLLIEGKRHATATERMPFKWAEYVSAKGDGFVEFEALSRGEQSDEYLLMGLRLKTGISPARFEALAGQKLRQEQIDHLTGIGFVEMLEDGNLRVTDKGWPVLDAVVADLAA
ncbi:radical SAM family heme chaperone HemW [Maritalea porphyrae]|uniref:radical SAM family heme chaperone HemW n=1 Tax=Maritalea porphyrae TaxID=880732 RepID=UPI0022AEE705|nr:radical SAM family heme chaperone HemW [Maritalea porphyrae]MCZ4272216.1 radical SAM family heme chaperone HemW [Maritalea porphyrae]